MPLDDEGAEGHAAGEHQPTAADYASQMKRSMVRLLQNAGHATCEYLDRVSYDPASGMVICGCGVFELWQQESDPNTPPWESSTEENNAIHRGMQRAAEQDEALQSTAMGLPAPGHPRGGHDLPAPADPIRATLALIDPTQIYTPEDVERHILEVLYRLETGALFERETVEAASATEMAFTRKFNAAVDASEQSAADRRKAEAMVKADAEYEAMMQAKMVKEAVKQTMHNLRAVLSGYQSTARSVGSAYQAGGSQGAPQRRDGSPW
jgi:hypothetical protein